MALYVIAAVTRGLVGYASQAQELTLAAGIVLHENEIFVREHHRDTKKLSEIAGHALVKRSQS